MLDHINSTLTKKLVWPNSTTSFIIGSMRVDSSLKSIMTCVDRYENKTIHEKFIEKNKCLCASGKLEYEPMYIYQAF